MHFKTLLLPTVIAAACLPSISSAQPDQGQATACPCDAMKERHREMSERMRQQDAEVRAKLEEAKRSSGEERDKRIVELLDKMVQQREKMHAEMDQKMACARQCGKGGPRDKEHKQKREDSENDED